MGKGEKIIGLILTILSIVVFYYIWWHLVPFITGTIPAGAWHDFIVIAVTILCGFFGGITIPLVILCFGLRLLLLE